MEDFILEFEKLYNRIMQKIMILPPAVVALKLLDTSQIDSYNRKLVLNVVDYNKVNILFDQMKNALQKFHGHQAILTSSAAIKIEAALEATSVSVYYGNNQRSNCRRSRDRITFPELKRQQEILSQAAVVQKILEKEQMQLDLMENL